MGGGGERKGGGRTWERKEIVEGICSGRDLKKRYVMQKWSPARIAPLGTFLAADFGSV